MIFQRGTDLFTPLPQDMLDSEMYNIIAIVTISTSTILPLLVPPFPFPPSGILPRLADHHHAAANREDNAADRDEGGFLLPHPPPHPCINLSGEGADLGSNCLSFN
ncbi:unnamed protein product [Hydatigera taeniaeformis]|uniref:Uncharacterized protein n=1 Tax=Hydatigena taeniaeformis TaxID=6205 RepID=A0A0R3WYL4_HYDTA|nr:unnamed protein product [Hydatigera taeniaeformis]